MMVAALALLLAPPALDCADHDPYPDGYADCRLALSDGALLALEVQGDGMIAVTHYASEDAQGVNAAMMTAPEPQGAPRVLALESGEAVLVSQALYGRAVSYTLFADQGDGWGWAMAGSLVAENIGVRSGSLFEAETESPSSLYETHYRLGEMMLEEAAVLRVDYGAQTCEVIEDTGGNAQALRAACQADWFSE
jgi:hypothetical protein